MPSRYRLPFLALSLACSCVCLVTIALAVAATAQQPGASQQQPPIGQQAEQNQSPLSDETAAEVKRVIQSLRQMLREKDTPVRVAAVRSLARLETYDPAIGDEIRELANDPDPEVADAAIRAILSKPALIANAIELLIERLGAENTDDLMRETICDSLTGLVVATSLVPPAIEALESDSVARQNGACRLLSSIGGPARDALPALLKFASTPQSGSTVRSAAIDTLGTITAAAAQDETRARALLASVGPYVDDTLRRSDTNGNGQIDPDEQVRVSMTIMSSSTGPRFGANADADSHAVVPAQLLDSNGDGIVTRDEIASFCSQRLNSRSRGGRSSSRGGDRGTGDFDAQGGFGRRGGD